MPKYKKTVRLGRAKVAMMNEARKAKRTGQNSYDETPTSKDSPVDSASTDNQTDAGPPLMEISNIQPMEISSNDIREDFTANLTKTQNIEETNENIEENEYSLQADDGNEIKVFCPKCNADISHTAKGIQEDQTKIVIAKVYHYFEQEYEELKKSFAGLDLTPLSKFHQRTALATGVSETKVLEILQEEARRNAEAREGPSQTEGPARKRPRQTDSSSEEESENNEDSDGEQSSTGPYAKETFVIKEEPAEECLESYKQETLVVKEEPEESLESYRQETLVVKEEPAEESLDSYNEESEIYVEEPEVKDEPGVSGANDALADPISIDFKTEPWIEEATSSNDTLGVQRATKSYKGRKTKRSAEAPPSASAPPTPNAPLAPPGGQLLLLHEGDIKMEQIESEEGFS